MTLRNIPQQNHKQTGVALLILVMALVIGAITYAFSGISIESIEQDRKLHTQKVLSQAKQALIAYAITHADRPGDAGEYGYLPCPNMSTTPEEGNQEINCDSALVNSVGWLPWKSLDLPLLYDGDGACLMYAVSSSYKLNPLSNSKILNEDSVGMFQVVDSLGVVTKGANPEDRPVAIIFAPGKALSGQTRNFTANTACGQDYGNVSAYLEGNGVTDNGVLSATDNEVDQFIHGTATSQDEATPYNDWFITITRDEIWSAIVARDDFQNKMEDLTEALAICLANYANDNIDIGGEPDIDIDGKADNLDNSNDTGRRLPWPVKFDLSGDSSALDDSYTDDDEMEGVFGDGFAGRYPYRINKSNADLGLGGTDVLFDRGICGATGPLTNGNDVDLSDVNSEFRKLYFNWKDHFFYILSDAYKPAAGSINKCDTNICVSVLKGLFTDDYAGIVIYAGTRSDGVINDLADATEYIEAINSANFPVYDNPNPVTINENGGNLYRYNNGNDVMFCITDEETHDVGSVTDAGPPIVSYVTYPPFTLSVNACP